MGDLVRAESIGRIGRYDVLGRLAVGGMAEILLARDRDGARPVVIKRTLPQLAQGALGDKLGDAFVHEAEVAMRLAHPHICAVHEVGASRGRMYLVMEWVNGVTLAELLARAGAGAVPLPIVARLIADVAAALDHAHRATDERGQSLGIVHRDVTPDNVMIAYDGAVKLLDFGIARARMLIPRTHAGEVKGKVAYLSPEQLRGDEAPDARADVFALGVCAHEAITGRPLFHRASQIETVAAITVGEEAPSPRATRTDLDPEIDALVMQALQKDRRRRLASAGEMRDRLEAWLAAHGHAVGPADIAAYVRGLFTERADAAPRLETRGIDVDPDAPRGDDGRSSGRPSRPKPRARSMTPDMQRVILAADADDEMAAFASRERRKSFLVGLVILLVVAAVLGAILVVAAQSR